jgi:hypothetical protein
MSAAKPPRPPVTSPGRREAHAIQRERVVWSLLLRPAQSKRR